MGKIDDIKPKIYTQKSRIPKNIPIINLFDCAIEELFLIDNPQYKDKVYRTKERVTKYRIEHEFVKNWIFYPNNKRAIFTVGESDYLKIRTARNRNVITASEQQKYRDIKIGIIGMSIGSVVLSSLVATGGPKNIRIADDDVIEISNLNRMWADILDVGNAKVLAVANKVWQLDPFANIEICNEKINDDSILSFLCGGTPINVLIDTMDSLPLKVKAREICKEKKIPVIMATSNGDGIILDIERFDIEDNVMVFNGRLGDIKPSDFDFSNYNEWLQKALELVDPEILALRVKESISELGITLSSVPQLSTTVHLGASAVAFAIRKIANNQSLPSGRYLLSLEQIIK